MQIMLENSFYNNTKEKDDLLRDKEKVASAFFINFLGTLGLFAISSSRGLMKTYFADDYKLQIVNIGDANKDVSLATKLYYDIGGIKTDTVNKITRLLVKLKTRSITSDNFKEEYVREIIKEIPYVSHRPHPLVLNIVKEFESGTANIKQVAKALFLLVKSKKQDFESISREFFEIAKQYQIYFKDIPDIGSVSQVTPASKTTQTTENPFLDTPTSKSSSKSTFIPDDEFYLKLWRSKSSNELKNVLKEYGYSVGLTDEQIWNILNYLLPVSRASSNVFYDTISTMPGVIDFYNGFGSLLKNDKEKINRALMAFLYKFSTYNTYEKIKTELSILVTPLSKFFKEPYDKTLDEKTRDELFVKIRNTMFNYYQEKISKAKVDDYIKGIFNEFKGEFEFFLNFGMPMIEIFEFPQDSKLTDREKLKYFIAYASVYDIFPFSYISEIKIRNSLFKLLNDLRIDYRKDNFGVIFIEDYDNIFPNSKALIEKWFNNKDNNNKLVVFNFGNIYEQIASSLIEGKEKGIVKISQNIRILSKKSTEEVVDLILKEIDSKTQDKEEIFKNIILSPVYLGNNLVYDSETLSIFSKIHLEFVNRFLGYVSNGSFKIEFGDSITNEFIRYVHKFVDTFYYPNRETFSDSTVTDEQHLEKFTKLFKNIVTLSKELQKYYLQYSFENSTKFLTHIKWLNADPSVVIEVIFKNEFLFNYREIRDYLMKREFASYLSDNHYSIIANTYPISDFLKLSYKHNINPRRFGNYNEIKKNISDVLNYRSIVFNPSDDFIVYSFNLLDEKDKNKILNDMGNNTIFSKGPNGNVVFLGPDRIRVYEKFAGPEKTKEFLNSRDLDSKISIFRNYPNFFIKRIENFDEIISFVFDNLEKYKIILTFEIADAIAENKDKLSIETIVKAIKLFSNYDRNLSPSKRSEFEEMYFVVLHALVKRDLAKAEEIYSKMSIEDKRSFAGYITKYSFVSDVLNQIQSDTVLIKPFESIDEKHLIQILKYNDIKLPRKPVVKEKDSLSEVIRKIPRDIKINDLNVKLLDLSEEDLERMSVEYDKYNRYVHGDIAIRFLRVFDVNLPIQEEGFRSWLQKMKDEGINPKILRPVFHGTGSIGASMILRYGFKVIKSSDPLVVGRMLGDGIYFSNVLDKVAQYVSDNGYGRKIGTEGYIFEMEASLGKHPRDYRCAGTGAPEDEERTVSPEWAVFSPNEQLRIYRAYHVKIISDVEMERLKKKYGEINEMTNEKIKSFKQFLNENTNSKFTNTTTYIFMDGSIPVSRNKAVEFEDFNVSKFGKDVILDWTAQGPAVMFQNTKDFETHVIRYTRDFMLDKYGEFTKFLELLEGKR